MKKLQIFVLEKETGKKRPNVPVVLKLNTITNDVISKTIVLGILQSDHVGYLSYKIDVKNFLKGIDLHSLVSSRFTKPEQKEFFEQQMAIVGRLIDEGKISEAIEAITNFSESIRTQFNITPLWNEIAELFNLSESQISKIGGLTDISQPLVTYKYAVVIEALTGSPGNQKTVEIDSKEGRTIITFEIAKDVQKEDRNNFPSYLPNPDIHDRVVSPSSFANTSRFLIGQGGCEELLHNALAERVFYFKEIVIGSKFDLPRLSDIENGVREVRRGKLVTFSNSWFPMGHALGEIVYSLALAPCEQVKIAVVDWSREDLASRKEGIEYTEQLNHNQQRDRVIEETVSAALKERQSSQSTTLGASVSGGFGGIGASISAAHSWSNSQGERNSEANSLQNLTDSFLQASSMARGMYSTLVVQSSQKEASTAQTRTIRNHNHSHALTVLYYEVLRQYRIVNEISNTEDLIFIKFDFDLFESEKNDEVEEIKFIPEYYSIMKQFAIEPFLFEEYENLTKRKTRIYVEENKHASSSAAILYGFEVKMLVAGIDVDVVAGPTAPLSINRCSQSIFLLINLSGNLTIAYELADKDRILSTGADVLVNFRADIEVGNWKIFDISNLPGDWLPFNPYDIDVSKISSIGIFSQYYIDGVAIRDSVLNEKDILSSWILKRFEVKLRYRNMITPFIMCNIELTEQQWHRFDASNKYDFFVTNEINKPSEIDSAISSQYSRELDEPGSIEKTKSALADHIKEYNNYYYRKIIENLGPDFFIKELDKIQYGPEYTLLDVTDPKPIELLGEYVVFRHFPLESGDIIDLKIKGERIETLISLPTRGVFAETKLSHCNASEIIDESRFWRWSEEPCPDEATEIQPVSTDSRAQTPNLTPSQLPNSVLNIVNPSAAPDPTGLSAAMGLLGSLGAFDLAKGDQANIAAISQGNLANARAMAEISAAKDIQKKAQQNMDNMIDKIDKQVRSGGLSSEVGKKLKEDVFRAANDGGLEKIVNNSASTKLDNANLRNTLDKIGRTGGKLEITDKDGSVKYENNMPKSGSSAGVDITNWVRLIKFKPDQNIIDQLKNRDVQIQYLDDANSFALLNMDFYPIRVSKLPSIEGRPAEPDVVLEFIRRNINTLIDNNIATFSPYKSPEDSNLFFSNDPLGSVLSIDIINYVLGQDLMGDNAAVTVSFHNERKWIFSTVQVGFGEGGYHPVSGNREFGYYQKSNGDYIFYTKGVDRTTGALETVAGNIGLVSWLPLEPFEEQDKLWKSFQNGVRQLVTTFSGEAEVLTRYSHHFNYNDWLVMRDQYGI